MNILKPRHLIKGDKIGVIAPSYPFPNNDEEYLNQYLNGKNEIEKMGFEIVESRNLRKQRWWMAGSPKERADDINQMFSNPEIKAIIAHDGGSAAIDILEYLNYELILNNPKPLIGFSDITNLLIAMYTKCGLVGFHMGLLSYTLGHVWHDIIKDENILNIGRKIYSDVLTSTKPLGILPHISQWENWKNGEADGILFGGNLSMLTSLIGTKYFPNLERLKGNILFWENDKTETYKIHRQLYQLKYSGILDVISGMVIGKLPDIKPSGENGMYEPTTKEIVMDIVSEYTFPILAEVDFGHKNINLPIPIGINAKIDSDKLLIDLKDSLMV